ncbi:MAG: hypothetical protein JJU03_12270 [Idiomarina sp.]|nr:hypothetical protein [Idiomarina sp.]
MSVGQLALRCSAVVLVTLLAAACTATPSVDDSAQALQHHTDSLANGIFNPSHATQPQRIGVGSLVPVHSLRQQGSNRDRIMVQQIQEGLISAATQRGAHIVEYRTSRQLRLEDHQELMLSRDVAELSNRQRLDYFLTGTYSEVSGGLLVNLRLINVQDNSVARAATHFFPWGAIQGEGALSEIRHGQLYRHAAPATLSQVHRLDTQRTERYGSEKIQGSPQRAMTRQRQP